MNDKYIIYCETQELWDIVLGHINSYTCAWHNYYTTYPPKTACLYITELLPSRRFEPTCCNRTFFNNNYNTRAMTAQQYLSAHALLPTSSFDDTLLITT